MQKKLLWIGFVIVLTNSFQLNAQYQKDDTTFKKCYVGSTFFVLGNLASKNKPDFIQLNFGYRITGKDVISLELKTWKYAWPLGVPYGKAFNSAAEEFPGYIREYGFAIAYQRFFWKGMLSWRNGKR